MSKNAILIFFKQMDTEGNVNILSYLLEEIPGAQTEGDEQTDDVIRGELVVDDVVPGVSRAAREVDVIRHVGY